MTVPDEIRQRLDKVDREILMVREELNALGVLHLAGELSAVSIILYEIRRPGTIEDCQRDEARHLVKAPKKG